MTTKQIHKLQTGDQVKWTDPDANLCSTIITIRTIEIREDMVRIEGKNGESLECFAHELS